MCLLLLVHRFHFLWHVVKCAIFSLFKLTAVFLICPILTFSIAITMPVFWYTLVHGSATVKLWRQTGFGCCEQTQGRMKRKCKCMNREISKTCNYSCTIIYSWQLQLYGGFNRVFHCHSHNIRKSIIGHPKQEFGSKQQHNDRNKHTYVKNIQINRENKYLKSI